MTFLARHGQTEWNVRDRKQGQLDSPLTLLGIEQARRNAAVVRDVDLVFSSPLGRARTTADIFAEQLNATVVVVDELAELNHGRFAGMTSDEIDARYPGELSRRAADKYRWRFPDGESYADVDVRAGMALRRIEEHGTVRPLIVSHEMIGRMLLRNLLDLAVDDALGRKQPHNVIYHVTSGELTELVT